MHISAKIFSVIIALCIITVVTPLTAFASSLSVSAVVPANATSFSAVLTSDTTATVGQGTNITYTLTYGSTLNTSTPITLEASWSRGTIEGSGAQADVVSYEPGSATDAYGSTPAVIDSVNQKITWDIASFDANVTNQQVSFKLKTSSTLTSTPKINFTVSGDLKGPGFTTTPSTVTNSFSTYSAPGPTNTPGPTPTPTAGPRTTPTPSISPPSTPNVSVSPPILTDVSIRTITSDSASIAVTSTTPTAIRIAYGENLAALTTVVDDDSNTTNHLVSLSQLKSGTTYFFTVFYDSKRSDIYTFTTALPGDVPAPILPSLVITSGNTVITTPLKNTSTFSQSQILMLPTGTFYEFRISIPNPTNIKRVQAVLRNANILAAASTGQDATTTTLDLIEISPGIFTGRLITPTDLGNYLLVLRISDKKGNIVEQKITEIRVTQPFRVQDESGKPIESARIKLWYFDQRNKKYFYLDPQSTSIPNPSFSKNNGLVEIVLPEGKYKAEISDLRYHTKTVTFSVGGAATDSYPTVILNSAPFNLLNVITYYYTTLHDLFFQQTQIYFSSISESGRMLDLVAFIIMLSFTLLLGISFISRIQISIMSLPAYLLYLFRRHIHTAQQIDTIEGVVKDAESERPLSGVTIYIKDEVTDQIIGHAITNKNGGFVLTHLAHNSYTLSVLKSLYRPFVIQSVSPYLSKRLLLIALSKHKHDKNISHIISDILLHILGTGFEIILIISLVLILLIGMTLGWTEVLPFLLLAVFNLITWLLHHHYRAVRTV